MKDNLNIILDKRNKNLVITVDSKPAIQINLNYLKELLKFAESGEILREDVSEARKINLFYTTYQKQRNKFFNQQLPIKKITKSNKLYKDFKKAIQICDDLDMPYDYFIKAQVTGLSFNGKQSFPQAGALHTDNAITRAMNYKNRFKVIKNSEEATSIPESDIVGSLKLNKKYQKCLALVKNNNASDLEVKYVYELLLAKGIEIPKIVIQRMESVKND